MSEEEWPGSAIPRSHFSEVIITSYTPTKTNSDSLHPSSWLSFSLHLATSSFSSCFLLFLVETSSFFAPCFFVLFFVLLFLWCYYIYLLLDLQRRLRNLPLPILLSDSQVEHSECNSKPESLSKYKNHKRKTKISHDNIISMADPTSLEREDDKFFRRDVFVTSMFVIMTWSHIAKQIRTCEDMVYTDFGQRRKIFLFDLLQPYSLQLREGKKGSQ